eukprot:TRINITY_DN771_c0_g1_i12.p1 TRINITY_DN771_c0_g1~~TRINITY_DN771_c0_g1_i12.p1  ORF type:complete len:231 (+),score=32.09 TRINITY_DN771_c0_g1_i12:492-1184(+)
MGSRGAREKTNTFLDTGSLFELSSDRLALWWPTEALGSLLRNSTNRNQGNYSSSSSGTVHIGASYQPRLPGATRFHRQPPLMPQTDTLAAAVSAQEVTEDILMEAWDKCREKNMDMTRAVASVPTRAHTQLQVISSRPPLPAHALLPTLGLQQQQQQQQLSSLISCLCSPPSRVHLVPCHPVLYKIVLSHHQLCCLIISATKLCCLINGSRELFFDNILLLKQTFSFQEM